MSRSIVRKFGVRITAAIVIAMMGVIFISGIMVYQLTYKTKFEELRSRLKILAHTAALNVDLPLLEKIPLSREAVHTPAYWMLGDYLRRIKAANRQIKSIYILKKVDPSNIWRFVVDEDERNNHNATCLPGDSYDAGRFPQMLDGYNTPSADKKIEPDEWGLTLSGYAPIRDPDGRPIAVLGIDVDAKDLHDIQKHLFSQIMLISSLGMVLALLISFLISQRVTAPVEKLIAGTRYIGEGNLHYRVQVPGDDEISALAESFNQMAKNLNLSRQQLLNYFLDTTKSMVKILEYRDHYTLGHSESVASYADRIAAQMGIDPKTREMFYNVCLLHDIGKVGVRDSILLKPDRLTDEEWKKIQLHPVFGEQILKHVLQDKNMLAVIRNHHERYDGKGYPDGWKQEQIPLLVAIATVADAFDAMTSNRSYRNAMEREQAIDQLIKNRGIQFHPDVVDAFLIVLSKEQRPSKIN